MKEDQLLDEIQNPLSIGNLAEINHYIISKTEDGTLEIKLAGSRKKFYLIAFSILAILVFFLILILINSKGDFADGLFAILVIVSISILLLRIGFTLLQKIKWHFTETELIIFNNARRKKRIPRKEIEAIIIYQIATGIDYRDFDQTFWLILKTDEKKYEDGKLYLLKIEGDSSRKNLELRSETEDIHNPLIETTSIALFISGHWNIPVHDDDSVID